MSSKTESKLNKLVYAVISSSKYKRVSPEFIALIGSEELKKHRNIKTAIKSTKNKLHQVGGAYSNYRKNNYSAWLKELKKVSLSNNDEEIRTTCINIMEYHLSTKERVPVLNQFYSTILSEIPSARSILDIACGLNPLSIPWMQLESNVQYYACDIYQDMMAFINGFFEVFNISGKAMVCDIIQSYPIEKNIDVDIVFAFKILPCIDQIEKGAAIRVLEKLNTRYIAVSFPIQSMSGRNKGMTTNYDVRFKKMLTDKNWSFNLYKFTSEIVFLIKK